MSFHSAVSALRPTAPNSPSFQKGKSPNAKLRSAVNALRITTSHNQTRWGDFDVLTSSSTASNDDLLDQLTNEKLRNHLKARGEDWEEGNKAELVERLRESLNVERQLKHAKETELEAKHRAIAGE